MFINKIIDITNNKVKKYGAQYFTFAIFGIINYPAALIYEIIWQNKLDSLVVRLLAFSLSLILLFHNYWPNKHKKLLPLFWYISIAFCVPFFTSFMLLKNNMSLGWLINFNIGTMIAILLLDSLSFLIIESIGIILGILFFFITGNHLNYQINTENLYLFCYMFFCTVIFGTIFTRNREFFNHFIQKAKDDANHELENKVKERTLELQQALATKTEFLNNISHEIRTPIQGFTVLSQGLVDNWNVFDEHKKLKLAKSVADNAARLSTLMLNLLDLSKFSNNKMILNLEKIDLVLNTKEMIQESKDLYIMDKKIKIKFNKPNVAILTADQEKIRQVLRNLFSNAIKFSPVNALLEVNIYDLENQWKFSIIDEGIGIPKEELESIFDAFIQSSRTKTGAGGTGLGLSICKKIIEAHNGIIWAEKNPTKQGAALHFIIPKLNVI